jgi:hypothetical protein
VVEEIIQRRLVWTFAIGDWWILRFQKLSNQKCSERQFWGFFPKYFKNIFWLVFGLFQGSKRGAPAPVRGSECGGKNDGFRPRETLTGTGEILFPRIYGV